MKKDIDLDWDIVNKKGYWHVNIFDKISGKNLHSDTFPEFYYSQETAGLRCMSKYLMSLPQFASDEVVLGPDETTLISFNAKGWPVRIVVNGEQVRQATSIELKWDIKEQKVAKVNVGMLVMGEVKK
jgi:hypothetical protein